jgi:peptide/nickel transport system ATP-binding protein/oligopeptide transport system ATP-binding protein
MTAATGALLDVQNLTTVIQGDGWTAPAVDDVSFSIRQGEILGIVGESGSGKSLTALSILRLLGSQVAIAGGAIRFEDRDLLHLSEEQMRRVRGAEISMIFQDPMTSLDGAFTVGEQLTETVRAHRRVSHAEAERQAVDMIDRVGISQASRRMDAYPHEFSGGMRQRVMIAMALILKPKLLLADEPSTALDVTTQAQIIELILELQREMGMSMILISHDLGVVLDVAERVAVMYAGHLVEVAASKTIFDAPLHPYTQGLLRSKLSLMSDEEYITVIDGQIPGLRQRPAACRFAPRCPQAIDVCVREVPPLKPVESGDRLLRCFNPKPWVPA